MIGHWLCSTYVGCAGYPLQKVLYAMTLVEKQDPSHCAVWSKNTMMRCVNYHEPNDHRGGNMEM